MPPAFPTRAAAAETVEMAWLERTSFLERNENHTRVFQGKLLVKSLTEATRKLDRLNLSPTGQNPVMVSGKSYSADYHHDEDYSHNKRYTVWLTDCTIIRK